MIAHCLFEQSGVFKKAFIERGIPAYDYDIQNEFGATDYVIDLFQEINKAFDYQPSIFDRIQQSDLIMAFFPCIHFCDAKTLIFRGVHSSQRKKEIYDIMRKNIPFSRDRQHFYEELLKLTVIIGERQLQMILENPWNTSHMTYLQNYYPKPSLIDKNRALRGDYYVKPTAYWFFNREPTYGASFQDKNTKPLIVYKQKGEHQETGVCDTARSAIHPDYAMNFISDFIFGEKTNKKTGYFSNQIIPF